MRSLTLSLLLIMLSLCGMAASPRVSAQAGNAVTFSAGWNLIALPAMSGFSSIQSLYTLQPCDTDYETIPPSQGSVDGFGYWAYFTSAQRELLAGGSGSPYSVMAPAGQYILVGDPSGILPASVSGADALYTYDPIAGYQLASSLMPGQGAWALSIAGSAITVTPQIATTVSAPAATATSSVLSGGDVNAGHTFYASTFRTANTIYCDDDPGWLSLSPTYLMSYPSLEAALTALPGYHLNRPC